MRRTCWAVVAAGWCAWTVSQADSRQYDSMPIDDVVGETTEDRSLGSSASVPPRVGRRIPEVIPLADLDLPELAARSVPLPEAETLSEHHFGRGMLGLLDRGNGAVARFAPQVILVKFSHARRVAALRVEPSCELEALEKLRARPDVLFAELDFLQVRQFIPDDTGLSNQWHHVTVGSPEAWEATLGSASIRLAIVDTPFQMDHPDLVANADPGWSVISNAVILASAGIDHSTAAAGMAAAVVNNGLGVAGAGNCRLVPVHITGFTEEMYNAILWCADQGVRVVNISWSGADSPTLNDAGHYLKTQTGGVLVMSGVNGTGPLDYPDHPHILCVSMTDQADNLRSHSGSHLDFAAPGFEVYSTLTASRYGTVTGTSFSTPLVAGIIAVVLGINPTLMPDEAIELLRGSAVDLGPAGWDPFFGWGRVNFGWVVQAALATLPRIDRVEFRGGTVTLIADYRPGLEYTLWKADALPPVPPVNWVRITGGTTTIAGATIELRDPDANSDSAFYQVRIEPSAANPP